MGCLESESNAVGLQCRGIWGMQGDGRTRIHYNRVVGELEHQSEEFGFHLVTQDNERFEQGDKNLEK